MILGHLGGITSCNMARFAPVSAALLVVICAVTSSCLTASGTRTADGTVWFTLSGDAATQLPPAYVSVTLDAGLIKRDFAPLNFTGVYATNMAKTLAPALLRIGGTSADSTSCA